LESVVSNLGDPADLLRRKEHIRSIEDIHDKIREQMQSFCKQQCDDLAFVKREAADAIETFMKDNRSCSQGALTQNSLSLQMQHAEAITAIRRDLDMITETIVNKQEHDATSSSVNARLTEHERDLPQIKNVMPESEPEATTKASTEKLDFINRIQLYHPQQDDILEHIKSDASIMKEALKTVGRVENFMCFRDIGSSVASEERHGVPERLQEQMKSLPLLQEIEPESKCQQQSHALAQAQVQMNEIKLLLSQKAGSDDLVLQGGFAESEAATEQAIQGTTDPLEDLETASDLPRSQQHIRYRPDVHTRTQWITNTCSIEGMTAQHDSICHSKSLEQHMGNLNKHEGHISDKGLAQEIQALELAMSHDTSLLVRAFSHT